MDMTRFRLAAAAVIAAAAAALVVVAAGGYFYQDDFLFLGQGHDASLNFSYLREGAFGHFFPGFRAIFWLQARTFGLDHGVAVALVAAVHVLAMVAMARLLLLLFGPRPGTLVLLGMFSFSGLWLSGYLWWVSALQVMPAMLLTIVAIDAYVRYVVAGRRRHILVAALALALSLCFYEKPVQLLALLPLLTVLAFTPTLTPRDVVRGLLRLWPMWAAFAGVLVVYAVAYLTGDFFVKTVHPSLGTMVRTVALGWHQGFVPAFLGGPVTLVQHGALGYPDPSRLQTIADQLVLLALVALSVRRRPDAWRGWAFLLVAFLLNVIVIAWTRAGAFGEGVGRELKYLIDILPFAVIGLGLAVLPLRVGARAQADLAPVNLLPRLSLRASRLALAAAAVVYLTAYGVSAARVGRFWHGWESPQFGRGFQQSEQRLPGGQDVVFLDQAVSEGVLAAAFQPYQRHSVLLRLFGTDLRYAGQATQTFIVEKGGTIGRRTVPAQTTLRPEAATIDGQPLVPSGRRGACVAADNAPHVVSIPLTVPLPPGRPYLRLVAPAPKPITLRFSQQGAIGDGAIHPDQRVTTMHLDGSARPLFLPLEAPGAATVDVLVTPGNPVCFQSGIAGVPTP
jgi:hypothetical protein